MLPCKPELSYSSPQDGYGHASEVVELRCSTDSNSGDQAFFRIDRTTYKSAPGNVHLEFMRYMDMVRAMKSDSHHGPKVMIVGQPQETHTNHSLENARVSGDLGYRNTGVRCFCNFYGLAGDSIIQAVMDVPRSLCPVGGSTSLTQQAERFYSSIIVEGV